MRYFEKHARRAPYPKSTVVLEFTRTEFTRISEDVTVNSHVYC